MNALEKFALPADLKKRNASKNEQQEKSEQKKCFFFFVKFVAHYLHTFHFNLSSRAHLNEDHGNFAYCLHFESHT